MRTKYLITMYQDLGNQMVQINSFINFEDNSETELEALLRVYDACKNLQETVSLALINLIHPVS